MKAMELNSLSKVLAFFVPALIAAAFLMPDFAVAGSAPSITTQPQNQTNLLGSNASFNVVAGGQTPLFYQWSFNGTNLTNSARIGGATNTTLTVSNVAAGDIGNYQVVVTNSRGSVTSSNATLYVLIPATITADPVSQSVIISNTASFTASATGTAPLSYRWYFNGAPLSDGGRVSGSTTANLILANVQTNDAGGYRLVVTNNYGMATSAIAMLTVFVPPYIIAQPTNQIVALSSNAGLSVLAGGTGPLGYQWYLNGAPLTDGSRISGSATASVSIAGAQVTDGGSYSVVITNQYGSVTSSVAAVGVTFATPGTMRFVNVNSLNPTRPYTSWSTAATNIQDAIGVSGDGDLVLVTNGIYAFGGGNMYGSNRVALTSQVTVQSINGFAATMITGVTNGSSVRCAYVTNGAVLAGFTLMNGSSASGGGIAFENLGGVAVNCLITGNYASDDGGGASGGVLYSCTIVGNNAAVGGGGTFAANMYNCVVSSNTASQGGGCYAGGAKNSVVLGNRAGDGGGGYDSSFANCVLAGNVAGGTFGGGAAYQTTLLNCTVVGNACTSFTGGVCGGAYSGNSYNSILYGNSSYSQPNAANYYHGYQLNCCTTPLPAGGSGNFASDPLFVNQGGRNYHLQTNSPCINAGNNAYVVGTADVDGNARVIGLIVDVGAYEFTTPTYFNIQPQSQFVNVGQTATFTASATGPFPVVYQWYYNAAAIAGATNSSLTLSGVTAASDGTYTVVASNSFVSVTSMGAILTVVYPPPGIISQPGNLTVIVGSNAMFTVVATNDITMSYQWLFNGTNLTDGGGIIGSATSNLNLSAVSISEGGAYQVIVSNPFGSVTSSVATLTVALPPTIVNQPTNETVVQGNLVTFAVTASGTGPFSYQWLFNGSGLPGDLITTMAGNGLGGFGGDGGVATMAMLNSPQGVVLDTNHDLFVLDVANNRVREIDANGIIRTVAGSGTNGFSGDGGPATAANLSSPGGIGFDMAGNLVIADTGNQRVRRIGPDGNINTIAGIGMSGFSGDGGPAVNATLNSPDGICFDSAGNLYIADTQNHRVRRVGLDGNINTVAGNGTWGVYGSDGVQATNTTISFPVSVVVDSSGNLFISESGENRIRKVAPNGIISTVAGNGNPTYGGDGGLATSASLYYPMGICLDASGDILIADEANNRIRMVGTNGIISTVAGNGNWVYSGDNVAATNASINFPIGVTVDGAGNLFVADTGDNRLREVTAEMGPTLTMNPVMTNLAGPYQVVVSSPYGSVTSSVATLTVLQAPAIAVQPMNQYVLLGGIATFTATAMGDLPLSYRWLFNGAPLSDGGRISGSGTSALAIQNVQAGDVGAYSLLVTNNWGSITSSPANLAIATARYVNANNPSPAAPYTSWATAAQVIQNAIDAANVGDWIIVTNGTYNTGGRAVGANSQRWNRVVMTNQVTVVSVNGPLVTSILGDVSPDVHTYGTRCVWLGTGAKLSGFTVASGGNYYGIYSQYANDGSGGGIWGDSRSAVASDCIITGNYGVSYGAGADDCTLINCLVSGNNAGTSGSGGGVYNCTTINCTIVGNTAGLGGGAGYSTVENCIVLSNTAPTFGYPNAWASSVFNSCSTADAGGINNTTNDPAFVDYAGGDYRLQFTSPCIDTGSNAFVTLTTDLDGHPRITNGIVDMGAYEYQHAPWFLTSLTNQTVLAGSNFSLSISPALGDPASYQWWFNGVPMADGGRITGSASTYLTVALSQTNDSGNYWLTASNSSGTATTSVATVTVLLPVLITGQPTNLVTLVSNTARFTVTATGFAPPAYLWYSNGIPLVNGGRISGATSATLAISNVQTNDSGTAYQVAVTNIYGSVTSAVVTLTVLAPVQITSQPASQAVLLGGNAAFTVMATGSLPIGYQWYFNGAPLSDGGRIAGSATPTLNITGVQGSDAGGYVVVVTNSASAATSQTASLTPQSTLAPSVRYVSLISANPLPPYSSWSSAATNIQDAIDAAVAGDLVLVSNGTYSAGLRLVYGFTNRVAVNKAIAVQSVNGPATTTILGFNSVPAAFHPGRCAYLTNGSSLLGFTLSAGAGGNSGDVILNESGGGAWCEPGAVMISNCIFISNTASRYGGGVFRGTLLNCLLTNNTAAYGGGAASNSAFNCTFLRNIAEFQNAAYGGGAMGCTLSNCLLVGNQCISGGGGAGAALSTVVGCVLSNNYATQSGGGVFMGSVSYSLISSNRAYLGGGAYSNTLIECVLRNNLSLGGTGGAAYTTVLLGCTVVSNSPGIWNGTATNCIVYYNVNYNATDTKSVAYSCTIPAAGLGPGNFTNAPLFVNLAGADYHLQAASPAINSGVNAAVTVSNDFDGNPRIVGGTTDPGVYEYQTPASALSYAWLQQYGLPTDGSVDYLDLDGTGMNNYQKWIAGLNPTNPASVLVMQPLPPVTNSAAGITVSWQSVNTRTYYIQRATNLAAQPPFSAIQSNLVGHAGSTSFTDTSATNGGPYFYRVGVQ